MAALVGAMALAGLAGGCAPSQSRFAHLDQTRAREVARRLEAERGRELQEDLRTAFAARPPRNILVLSGGGADGAFGCGVLDGWRRAPGGRPTFDVVTGVSTGALIATFAFLGEQRDDAVLSQVYTHTRDADIHDSPFTPGPADSVFDTAPLKRLIARYVTDETIDRVAQAHHEGRRLYVATVDLDAGAVVIWPLSKLAAAGGPVSRARFRQVLLAAASVPVVFPPVEIDGDLHVDAGLREAVFLRKAMLGFTRAYDATRSTARPNIPPTVWAVINGRLEVDPQPVDDDLVDIGVRSLTLYTQSLQLFNVREVAHVAAAHDPPFEFRYIAMPRAMEPQPAPGLFTPMFDPARMGRLYRAGQAKGTKPDAWQKGPPLLDEDEGPRASAS
ncbi:MAG TPA: patatin-like phospholipase family protein [Tepidisphaeraceae bacterium]